MRTKGLELWRVPWREISPLELKMEMALVSMDVRDIVDGFKKIPPFNVDPKLLQEYQRCIRKTMFIISLNFINN